MTHTFKLHIHCNNAAFCDDSDTPTQASAAPELARILRQVADRLESGDSFDTFRTIHDVNGNDVGRFAMKEAAK